MTARKSHTADMKRVTEIEGGCCKLLAGQGRRIQGAVLACLVARHLASYPPEERLAVAERLDNTVGGLLPAYEGAVQRRRESH